MRRHASGTWRRTCGTIRRPAASPAAAASRQRGRDRDGRAATGAEPVPSSARPPNVATPPTSAPAANVAQETVVVRIRCA